MVNYCIFAAFLNRASYKGAFKLHKNVNLDFNLIIPPYF
jgi:hypothetical protein